ncbi:MAG: hypothetical protein RIQ81_204 [Pseudomonadota bacterium]
MFVVGGQVKGTFHGSYLEEIAHTVAIAFSRLQGHIRRLPGKEIQQGATVNASEIEKRLLEAFPDAKVKASDMTGGGDHWQLTIATKAFKGLSLVEQHQAVYKALGSWMRREIHALALTTKELD